MNGLRLRRVWPLLLLGALAIPSVAQTPEYRYFRVGNAANAAARARSGFALMGGGKDLDEAFRWLCERAEGGDFLVLRATGDDDYNPYIQKLCRLNSVATLLIPSRAAAADPFVAQRISEAGALFIAGGDQANYINFWMSTPVQSAVNAAIANGVPIGGTSAGLAVLGGYAYSAQGDTPDDPNLDGKTAMADPFGPRITLVNGFLRIPILKGVITDSHFAKRDRMGRLLVFLARLNQQDPTTVKTAPIGMRGIGVQERAAVLLEPDGRTTIVGQCCAYFLNMTRGAEVFTPGKPLSFAEFTVEKVAPGQFFNVLNWRGETTQYTLAIKDGTIHSSQRGGAIY
jgi:cyanophycinase